MNDKKLIIIGILGAKAVALGALGAHFLKSKIETGLITIDQVNGFDTGVKYHIYHTLGMLMIFLLSKNYTSKYLTWAFNCFFIGTIWTNNSNWRVVLYCRMVIYCHDRNYFKKII